MTVDLDQSPYEDRRRIQYDCHRLGEPTRRAASVASRIRARLLHEAREALPPTIFFFVGFNFIVLTTNLLVAQYLVAISNFMLATLAALVVGKAVLVANKISLLRRYDRAPLDPTDPVQDRLLLGHRALRASARASCPLLARGQCAGRFPSVSRYHLLLAALLRHFTVDPRPFPCLRNCIGIQPSIWPRRDAPPPVHASAF